MWPLCKRFSYMERRELFFDYYYHIAFRDKKRDSNGKWTVVPSSANVWYADPFLFEWDGKRYLFAERMNRWRLIGSIAVCEIRKDGSLSKFKEVIVEPFHLSFPNVFEYDGQIFMIPESGWNKDIRLYRATNFPLQWEFVKALTEGVNFVDTAFLSKIENGTAFLSSYDWDSRSSCYFKLDLNCMELNQLPDNPLMMNERNGGNAFMRDGMIYRVLQDCSDHYGSKVMIRRIDNKDYLSGHAVDSPSSEILADNLLINKKWKPKWCHTYNQSEHLEVIDFMVEHFVWFGPILCLRNKVFYERHKDLLGEA